MENGLNIKSTPKGSSDLIDNKDDDDLTVKNEILPDQISVEETLNKLEDVISFVKDRFESHLQCLLLYDSYQKPFLSVIFCYFCFSLHIVCKH